MGRPVATTTGTCFAFPDVLQTPTPVGTVPMPYPNVAQLSTASPVATTVTAGGRPVVLASSRIPSSSGGEPGTGGGVVVPGTHLGECAFVTFSASVTAEGQGVVRQGDTTAQNTLPHASTGNATGAVMVGLPTVLVGG